MKYPIPLFSSVLFSLIFYNADAQNADAALYDRFDQTIGKSNLGLNNGTIHTNDLRSANDTHRYYNTDKYILGNVTYDGQPYNGVALQYDLLKDILIAKPEGEKSAIGINLITQKTAGFTLNGKKFVNLNYNNPAAAKFPGFYEVDPAGKTTLYTKHHKDNIEVLRTEGVFYRYELRQTFVFRFKDAFYRLNSQSDATDVFPDLKKNIREFYERNTALERSDMKLFYLTLLKHIDKSLPN